MEASTILGLRVALTILCVEKEILFEAFKILVKPFTNFFGIELVLRHIRQEIDPNQKLIIVLHIDEYQEIFLSKAIGKEDRWGKDFLKRCCMPSDL